MTVRKAIAFMASIPCVEGLVVQPGTRFKPKSGFRFGSIVLQASASRFDDEKIRASCKDDLMRRTIQLQMSTFASIGNVAHRMWLRESWQSFIQGPGHIEGRLTDFFFVMNDMAPTSVFVPTRSVGRLSPNNPYAKKHRSGVEVEVEPSKVALRLTTCREQVALSWLDELAHLSAAAEAAVAKETRNGLVIVDFQNAADAQQLLGLAAQLAIREMLAELSVLPSRVHMHNWLSEFVLKKHATDLTRDGSVERLLTDLGNQPLHIRGGALVDPLEIRQELIEHTFDIIHRMSHHLCDAEADHTLVKASFLNSCLDL